MQIVLNDSKSTYVGLSTSITIDAPISTVGHLLVAVIAHDRASDPTVSIPDGWTTLFEEAGGSTYYGDLRFYYKVVTGQEPSSYTWTFTNPPVNDYIRGSVFSFSGVDTSNPIDVFATANSKGTADTTATFPSVTATTTNGYVIRAVSARSTSTPSVVFDSPAQVIYADSFKRPIVAVASSTQAAAGATGTLTATVATGSLYRPVTATVVLRPSIGSTAGGLIKVYNGTVFVAKPVKVWDGTAWIQKPVKRWNGSAWA